MDKKSNFKLEHDIASFIGTDNGCTVHFKYEKDFSKNLGVVTSDNDYDQIVSAYTVNPKSGETFLLIKKTAKTQETALKKILEYVKNQKGLSSFTVLWAKKGEASTSMNTSYFYCHDVLDVVEKFFAGKDSVNYVVYEIKLNPVA
jgi:hypothetical protein